MVSQVLIRLDKELMDKFQRLSRAEQKSINEKVRELVEEYDKEHDMETAMRRLWGEIGQSLRKKGYKARDVHKVIKENRKDMDGLLEEAVRPYRKSKARSKYVRGPVEEGRGMLKTKGRILKSLIKDRKREAKQ